MLLLASQTILKSSYLISDSIAAEMNRQDKIVELMQERQEKDARQLKKELTDYWRENQRPQDHKEFDLNDPDYKKKDLPARVSFHLRA